MSESPLVVKKTLKKFLFMCLEDDEMRHLIQWSDRQEGVFSILWIHGGSQVYLKGCHDTIFNKYREYRGLKMNKNDPKQSFRMAMKKSPDVIRLRERDTNDWRMYQFRPIGPTPIIVTSSANADSPYLDIHNTSNFVPSPSSSYVDSVEYDRSPISPSMPTMNYYPCDQNYSPFNNLDSRTATPDYYQRTYLQVPGSSYQTPSPSPANSPSYYPQTSSMSMQDNSTDYSSMYKTNSSTFNFDFDSMQTEDFRQISLPLAASSMPIDIPEARATSWEENEFNSYKFPITVNSEMDYINRSSFSNDVTLHMFDEKPWG